MSIITNPEMDKLYCNLPANTRAGLASNPDMFRQFIESNGIFGKEIFDNAILCRDRTTEEYTWHIMCGTYPLNQIRSDMARKLGVEPRIKQLRQGRDLECVEVVTRTGEHYFLQ